MAVPAFLTKEMERCQTNRPMVRRLGMWYNGISMIKAERCPLKSTLFNKAPEPTRAASESSTIPQVTRVALRPKKAGAMKATTAMRAVHGTRGAIRMVNKRAVGESITRVPMTAGTLQPNPRNKGRKDLPCKPMTCITLSMT